MAESALDASLRYLAAGMSVIPIRNDTTKAPAVAWDRLKKNHAAEKEVRHWHRNGDIGVAVACGPVSNDTIVFDFEYLDYYSAWEAELSTECRQVLETAPHVRTPGKDEAGGRHVYIRWPGVLRSTKLARMSHEEAERRCGDSGATTAIEIKGDGGYVLAPGCLPGCHKSGRLYSLLPGPDITEAPEVSDDILMEMVRIALELSCGVEKVARPQSSLSGGSGIGDRPGDDFCRRASWDEVLCPHGWVSMRSSGGVAFWTRPGKGTGVSATTGFCRSDSAGGLLYVFSTNAWPFEAERAYNLFGAYALLEHNGDFRKAAGGLARLGYGSATVQCATAPVTLNTSVEAVDGGGEELPPDGPPGGDISWPKHVLPAALERYAEELAVAMSCPVDFPAAVMLSISSALVGNARSLRVNRTWKEAGRIFLATVGEPGSGKSPAVKHLFKPLVSTQKKLSDAWQEQRDTYEQDVCNYEAASKAYARRRAEGKLHDQDEPPQRPSLPPFKHIFTTNATTEGLVPMLAENPRGFGVMKDELTSWINSMNQYKAGGKGDDRQFWLSVWGGETIKVDRKGDRDRGPVIVEDPLICLYGNIPPDHLGDIQDSKGRRDGMLDRFLFVYPEGGPWPEIIGTPPPEESDQAWLDAMAEMSSWEMDTTAGSAEPVYVDFTPGGIAVRDAWYAMHAREANAEGFDASLKSAWSKLRAYYFRLCLVIHCMRAACGEDVAAVDEDTTERAGALILYFKRHLLRVYGKLGSKPEDTLADRVARWVAGREGMRATARDIQRATFCKKASEAEAIIRDLVDRGYGTLEAGVKPKRGPTPQSVFVLAGAPAPKLYVPDNTTPTDKTGGTG